MPLPPALHSRRAAAQKIERRGEGRLVEPDLAVEHFTGRHLPCRCQRERVAFPKNPDVAQPRCEEHRAEQYEDQTRPMQTAL